MRAIVWSFQTGRYAPKSAGRAHLVVQRGDFLLVGGGEEEAAHLALQGVFHLHVDVVAGRFLVIVGVHANDGNASIKDERGRFERSWRRAHLMM